jgi:hypothetical protein
VRVIKPPPEFEPFVIDCAECEAELEVGLPDLKRAFGGDQRDPWDYAYFECPCCAHRNSVDRTEIPDYLYSKLPRTN